MGGYEAAEAHADEIDDVRRSAAEVLGFGVDEIAFQGSAIEGWWRAFLSIPIAPGDRVLASSSEHQSNAFGLLQARERGVVVDVVPNDTAGTIDLDALGSMIDERVKLVCLTQISMANGAVQPAAAVGRLCRGVGLPYLLDACQAAGQLPLDVDAHGVRLPVRHGPHVDAGPSSTVDALGPSPFVDGRSAEWLDRWDWQHTPGAQRFEIGERSYAGQIGLAVATRMRSTSGSGRSLRTSANCRAAAERNCPRSNVSSYATRAVIDQGSSRARSTDRPPPHRRRRPSGSPLLQHRRRARSTPRGTHCDRCRLTDQRGGSMAMRSRAPGGRVPALMAAPNDIQVSERATYSPSPPTMTTPSAGGMDATNSSLPAPLISP